MHDETAARLIDTALETLRTDVLSAVCDANARIKLDHATRMLWAASARIRTRETALATLAQDLGVRVENDPDAARREAEMLLNARLPELLENAPSVPGARDELHRIVAALKQFYVKQDPEVAGGAQLVYRGGRIETERPFPTAQNFTPLNADTLTDYVRRRFSDPGLSVRDVRNIPGGFSKETVFFTLLGQSGAGPQNLVIRKDISIPINDATVINEFPVLEKLYAAGFPVAKPLWVEADASLFGGTMLISERVAGSSDSAAWSGDPERAATACRELARIMAKIHAFAPEAAGYSAADAALSAGQWLEREIARWTAVFRTKRQEPYPLQELPLVWLAKNVPAALYSRPARFLHGDIGFHNLMFDEAGHATAVLDWEFSTLGDPTQDLRFARQFVAPLGLWDRFLEDYSAAGGAGYVEEAGFFFDLFTIVRNAVGCVQSQRLFDTVMPREGRFALAGHIFAPYLYVEQCEKLLSHIDEQAAGTV